jgi:hypothetical protein
VQWGAEPSDSRVYINGRRVGLDLIEGPRNMGPPGFEPTKTLSGYMHGFTASDGTAVGPPDRFVIGRIGLPVEGDRLVMGPPRSVAIVSVRITNFPIHD